LDPSTIAALGTDLYLDWEFVDQSIESPGHALRRVRLLVTYYTGKPDLVPHTPEVCWTATGAEVLTEEGVTLNVAGAGGVPLQIPARAVTFLRSAVYNHDQPTVVYTFHCNGAFLARRNLVRARLANPFDKGAYFCKVEVNFPGRPNRPASAGREESIEAAQKFLTRLLPVLLDEHLPDWEALQAGEGSAG
jgi:hypothetical protein